MARHIKKLSTVTLVGATFAVSVGIGGVAYAFWSTTASGTGAAVGGTPTPLTVTAGTSPTNALVPGGTGDVSFIITNNNKVSVTVTGLTMTNNGIGGFTDNTFATAKTGCTSTGVSWTTTSKTLTTPVVVAGNGGTYTLTLTGGVSMSTASDDGCQGAVFKMPVSGATATLAGATASSPTSGTQS